MKRTSPLAIAVVVALLAADGALAQGFGSGPVSLPVPIAPVLGGLALALALTWRHAAARRAALALGAATILFALGAPVYAAGALALLVMCVQRKEQVVGAAVAGAAVGASMVGAVSEQLAAVDLSLAAFALPFFGITPLVEGTTMSLGAGFAAVEPACAAVEGAAVAFVLSLCVRALLGQSQRRVMGMASAHMAAFLSVNLIRIVAVAVALETSAQLAETLHTWGGLLMFAVHIPFLAGPVRQLFARPRTPRVDAPAFALKPQFSLNRGALATAAVVAVALAAPAHALDAYFPLAGVDVDARALKTTSDLVHDNAALAGFEQVLPGAPSASAQPQAAAAALAAAGKGRVLSGVLSGTKGALVLEVFIASERGTVLGTARVPLAAPSDKKSVRKALGKALTAARDAPPEPAAPAAAAPAPAAPAVVAAAPAPAPAAAPAPEPAPAAEQAPVAAEEIAPQGPSYVLPIGLAVGALVAGGGALGTGLWASSDVDALKTGTATDVAGTRGSAMGKSIASDVLTVAAVGLGAGAAVLGTLAALAPPADPI